MPGEYATHPKGAPGSAKAVSNGCTCPVLDNHHGAGIGDGCFFIDSGCQVHNNHVDTLAIRMPANKPHR